MSLVKKLSQNLLSLGATNFGEHLKQNLSTRIKEHTIAGRMINNGDNIFEAIKNDFLEDTNLGQVISGESMATLTKASGSGFINDVIIQAYEDRYEGLEVPDIE